jgi:hypothetical protein
MGEATVRKSLVRVVKAFQKMARGPDAPLWLIV